MALDGKLLSRARDALAEIKEKNTSELLARTSAVYARCPELRSVDACLRSLMVEVVGAAVRAPSRPVSEIEAESLELQARRAELLVSMGYPADYLDEIHSCYVCRDTGFVNGKPCSCLLRLYEAEQARELSDLMILGSESFETFDLSWYDSAPVSDGESPRKHMERIVNMCRSYASSFGPGSVNLLFRGQTGLGKTFLSACIARAVSEKHFSVCYETVVSALDALETQKFSRFSDDADAVNARVRRILDCDLLILDDLGTEMLTSFTSSALYTIVNERLIRSRKTIISTNLTAEDLRRRYPAQLVSRLEGEYQAMEFFGRDIRLLKKERCVI